MTLTYVAVATAWIVGSGFVADAVATRTGVPLAVLEVAKGIGFVLVTAAVLYPSLRRWASRVQRAAVAEHVAADRLRNAEQMRGAFLTGVSHELRTPLTAIVGYSETLNRQAGRLEAASIQQLSGRLVLNAERLQRLVIDLLEVDRLTNGIGTLNPQPTDLTELVQRIVASSDVHDTDIEVVGHCATIDVDAPKIERMLQHLLDNAIRHAGGTASIVVRLEDGPDAVFLQVEDDGPGLPDELIGHIFDPFVQDARVAQKASPGIGIGLTLVAQFAALHGGTALAENRTGGGASFTVTFPRHAADAPSLRSGAATT